MEIKTCKRCNVEQPIENFKLRQRNNGNKKPFRASHCKPCWNEKNKEYLINNEDYRNKMRERQRIRIAEKRKANPEYHRKILFKSKNVTSWEEYKQMVLERNGRCDICNKIIVNCSEEIQFPTNGFGLKIDHDHSCCNVKGKKRCGKCNRGLLCHSCNVSLGGFQDNIEYLQSAIKYLEKYDV